MQQPEAEGLPHKLASLQREVFAAAFIDTRHRLIDYAELLLAMDGPRESARGSQGCADAQRGSGCGSANHPSGEPEPGRPAGRLPRG